LGEAVRGLRKGSLRWFAVIGSRKIGKTSLVLELSRRTAAQTVVFVVIDVHESAPLSLGIFRAYALRVVDGIFGPQSGESLESLAREPNAYRRALQSSNDFLRIPSALRSEVQELPDARWDAQFARNCLDLPERLAQATGRYLVVAIDEFERLSALASLRDGFDPFPLMRSVWQRHQRVTYIVSGSARSMLIELLTTQHAPFFQHFTLMDLEPFSSDDAVALLVEHSPRQKRIGKRLARRAVDAIGGHPFYLQLLGEALIDQPRPLDDSALKSAMQQLIFTRTGRLALYFENEFQRLVGRSTYLAATLEALASGPKRLSELAKQIVAPSGATSRYLERLADAVRRTDAGEYELADKAFGLWLRWRQPGGSVVPMRLLGDEAEQSVAEHLSRMGFDLVYQSRGSRGAFDLLATRESHQLGVQVKRSELPLRFSRDQWARMLVDAQRFGWHWIIAAVSPGGDVSVLDPAKARRGREVRLDADAIIDNVLLWLGKPK
jgi:AAA+ ATPase superfamily predicted ATPase/Holliday junction resolvase